MRLACVACRASLPAAAASDPPPLAHAQLARCCGCGGLFHAACRLLAPGAAAAQPFTCARCAGGSEAAPLPLLVPEEALAFIGGEAQAPEADSEEEEEDKDDDEWRAVAQVVAVCARCRQLRDESDERDESNENASCACGAAGGVFVDRRVCGLVRREQRGAWWAATCACCARSFCLEGFADGDASDAALDALRGARVSAEGAWTCAACVTRAPSQSSDPAQSSAGDASAGADRASSTAVGDGSVNSGDGSGLATHDDASCVSAPAAAELPEPAELMTVLICDGCESEFDFARLVPPLAEIPEGDWFCSACSSGPQLSSSAAEAADAPPMVSVTVLLCDGCEGEFDLEALSIPLSAVPEGDWFCPQCEALKKAKAKKRRDRKGKRPAPKPSGGVAPPPPPAAVVDTVVEELVTVLICDGCDGEFDAALLQPPVTEIPQGDWFCGACSASRSGPARRRSGKAAQRAARALPVRVDDDDDDREMHANDDDDDSFEVLENGQPANSRASRKRKRSLGYQAKRRGKSAKKSAEGELPSALPAGAVEAETTEFDANLPGVRIPQPVASVSSGGKQSDAGSVSGHLSAVLLSDDDGDEPEDEADAALGIVCDMCLAAFSMTDGVESARAPPRPWFCPNCVRGLKRTRKKRQRYSKQMLMEMQLFGELLRPTAAKAYDVKAAALRGKPPKTSTELKSLFELVGRRVAVYLKWDKHWVLGRVLSFEAGHPAFPHIVRFEDGVEKALPLYAFPLVVGTRSLVYVKVPTLQNRWWPGQLLRLNALAKKLLLPDADCAAAVANYRLVSIYTSGECKGQTQNVSCWVPKHLCRSLARFAPASLADDGPHVGAIDFRRSFKRALSESAREDEVLKLAFQRLLLQARRLGDEHWQELGRALVGLELVDDAVQGGDQSAPLVAARFDAETSALVVESGDGSRRVELRSDERRFFLRRASDYAEIAVRFSTTSIAEAENLQRNAALGSPPTDRHDEAAEPSCAVCLLPAEPAFEGSVDEATESLVECVKCAQSFHLACCDPPHDPAPLLNDDDGTAILEDVRAAFVCSKCTTCVGCATRSSADGSAESTEPCWSQWRLPLQVAALCAACVPFYEAKQFCSVCLAVLSDDAVVTCIDLHSCSTCLQWVHTACEPDPQPALVACKSSAEFELDVLLELPGLPASFGIAPSASGGAGKEATMPSSTSKPQVKEQPASAEGESEAKPMRLAEEEFALGLKFKDAYDPKALNKFECLSCRKLRMLQVLHRLKAEDKLELFKEPVTKAIAPTYFDVIKEPMDLSTMQAKVLADAYTRMNFRDLRDDFELMCLNAVTFNSKERDFLIWREAWRFYGQGQRILRQTAPKSRMKHRGGKYHDALVAAAKRQLPNNSAFGRTGFDAADDAFPGSAHGDNDDDVDMFEERGDAAKEHEPANGATAADPNATAAAAVSASAANREYAPIKTENGAASSDPPGVAATPLTNGAPTSFAAPTAERKEAAVVLQCELGEAPKPHSALQVFKMVQARATAHTYAWLDMCLACGSAGVAREMIFCVDCGEGFHSFCVPGLTPEQVDESAHLETFWRCPNCKMCEACGQPGGADDSALYFCGGCESGFHGSCLAPAIKPPSEDERSFGGAAGEGTGRIYCASCVQCHECGREQQETAYSYDPDSCLSCSQTKKFEATLRREKSKPLAQLWLSDARTQKKESEKCPMCKLHWTAEDEELIQCDACELWGHPTCDALLTSEPERYKKLVEDPSALYICEVCRPKEREHLAGVPNSWKVQVLVAAIQQKRELTDATWREARAQLEQAKQWKFWRDHTPVYLYLLRLGEECLKNLAFRSANFRTNWSRLTKEHELADHGAVLPAWLVQKASRYLRFKRYARGPRAALRRQDRKANNFYSRHGVEKHKDASAIAAIVSEASSCAALLACVHLFYGWRPLPKVALHLLSGDAAAAQGHARLSDATVKMLSHGGSDMTLEDEIAMINRQYERRVGKKPGVRDPNDAGDSSALSSGESSQKASPSNGQLKQQASPIASPSPAEALLSSAAGPASPTAPADAPATPTVPAVEPPAPAAASSTAPDATPAATPPEPSAATPSQTPEPAPSASADSSPAAASGAELVAPSAAPKRPVRMTKAAALCGWPSAEAGDTPDASTAIQAANAGHARPKFVDNRFCAFCFMIGDDLMCGRLIYADKDQWVHVNCALWSVEVFESADGVLHKCQKARNRSRLIRCDACGVLGASVGCAVYRCQRHYHFPCAYDAGVVFLPNGDTVCPKPDHIATMSRKQKTASTPKASVVASASVALVAYAADRSVEGAATSTTALTAGATEGGANSAAQANGTDAEEKRSEATPGDAPADSHAAEAPTGSEHDEVTTENEAQEPTAVSSTANATPDNGEKGDVAEETSESAAQINGDDAAADTATTTGDAAPVLSVVDPSPEPRRHLRSDLPIVVSDLKKQGAKSRRAKRAQCIRVGALTVQSFGHIVVGNPSFHSRDAIFPLGFRSTRIFWSTQARETRCLYECVVTSTDIEERTKSRKRKERDDADPDARTPARAVFKLVASDDREHPIVAFSAEDTVAELRSRVAALYEDPHCFGAMSDKNPFLTRTSWTSYGLPSAHFFGFGVPVVVEEIEQLPHAATTSIDRQLIATNLAKAAAGSRKRRFDAMDSALASSSSSRDEVYVFTKHLPAPKQFEDALREVEQLVMAEERARLSSGSSRTDGHEGFVPHDGDAPRVAPLRRRLNKQASREPETQLTATVASSSSSANAGAATASTSAAGAAAGGANTKSSSGVAMDLEHLPIAMQYRELRRRPFDERLEVRKSKIHGYGLFTKETMAEGQMIVEYQGQMIAQDVADEREKQYEEMGIGSCYMFRLDEKTIIDATRVGNLARFINHSCDPKAYARVVVVEGNEKKIVIFAKRAIDAGDEVTYDYKFPIEDEAIRCDCSAPNCVGRMN